MLFWNLLIFNVWTKTGKQNQVPWMKKKKAIKVCEISVHKL